MNEIFENIKRKLESERGNLKKIIATVITSVIISSVMATYKLAYDYEEEAYEFYKAYVSKTTIKSYENNSKIPEKQKMILISGDNDQLYVPVNKEIVLFDSNIKKTSFFNINIYGGVIVDFPYYLVYDFDGIQVMIGVFYTHFISDLLFDILLLSSIMFNIGFFISYMDSNFKIKALKISVQEYALSQRATMYLVSIIHHKLNSPIKVLTTKTRMLHDLIQVKLEGRDGMDVSNACYMDIKQSFDTISGVTNKLKLLNELDAFDSNLYTMLSVSATFIDVLRYEEFHVDIKNDIKKYHLDNSLVNQHEIIQIFLNLFRFSLYQLADKVIIINMEKSDSSITLVYSDNGNRMEEGLIDILESNLNISELAHKKLCSEYYDLVLNFIILNNKHYDSVGIRLVSTSKEGNVFKLTLPICKTNLCQT